MTASRRKLLREKWQAMPTERREAIADAAGTTPAYLRQVLACGRKPGAAMAKNIEAASGGEVTRQMLRPDLFADMAPLPAA